MSMDQESHPPENRRRPTANVLVWGVILLLTALLIGAPRNGLDAEAERGPLGQTLFTLQAQYLLGAVQLVGDQQLGAIQRTLDRWQTTTDWQRIRLAVLVAEVQDPEAGLQRLREVQGAQDAEGDEGTSVEILTRIFEDYSQDEWSAPSITPQERERLKSQLGWFGKLALAPPERQGPLREQVIAEARQTFFSVIAAVVAVGVVGILGLFVLLVFGALLFSGKLSGMKVDRGYGGVYLETFAVWLVLFLGLSVGTSLWLGSEPLAAIGLISLGGSLLALVWPLLRGVSWQRLREDMGWTMGRGLVRECLFGLGCYAMAIPLIFLTAILTSLAVGIAGDPGEPGDMPVHPIAIWLAEASWWQMVQVILLACVVAPIVEEIMFRGLLYRHLREATDSPRGWPSVVFSALVASVLFAVLHPQGLPAVPGIVGIALALACMREWRTTLVPSIVAHAVNNGVIMLVLIALLKQ
ncbi:MAG: CPBP family intramembrane metalloprotease [Planctomycetaceae bacterium]|nr:MAG: CPBP family intramembrane metalloprotease [Planctomycetaceae bacterium]